MIERRQILAMILAAPPLLTVLGSGPAQAQSLNDLRKSGAIGERFDGFAEARDSSARGFADTVNAKRRAEYEKVAASEGISVDQVGRVFAQKIIAKLPKGAWYLPEGGSWKRK
jgi:uncharacterized protein YdbL (DUF1318 family)